MARPRRQGLAYFPHDTDASTDEKILAMEGLHGLDGYAVYFKLLERIYRMPDGQLNISDSQTRKIYARNMHISQKKLESILETAVKRGLFDDELYRGGILTSDGIKERLKCVNAKRIYMREEYQRSKVKDGISESETREETITEIPQSKGKKSKKKNTYGEFQNVELTSKEYDRLIVKFGEALALMKIEELSEAMASNKKYQNKYSSHYATILAWYRRKAPQIRVHNKPEDFNLE